VKKRRTELFGKALRERNRRLLISLGFQLGTLRRDCEFTEDYKYRLLRGHADFALGFDAGSLDNKTRSSLQIMLLCRGSLPIADLRGDLTRAELIDERGFLTDRGRDLAAVLAELDDRETPDE
jgi:hypothetical protein